MKKTILNAILIGLLSIFVVACGEAGDEELGFGQELNEEDVGNVDEENLDEQDLEEEDVEEEEEEENVDEDPFCGDGNVDEDEECDDANEEDGDGCSSVCEVEVFEGETEGEIVIDLIVDDLSSNEQPLATGCTGTIALTVSDTILVGDGRCFLPSNVLDYTLSADVSEDGFVEGDIIITLNNGRNALPVTGSLDDGGVLSLEFDGVTIIVGNIRGVWDGTIAAEFD